MLDAYGMSVTKDTNMTKILSCLPRIYVLLMGDRKTSRHVEWSKHLWIYRELGDRAVRHMSQIKGVFTESWCLQTYTGQAQGSGVWCSKQREQHVQRLRGHREPGGPLQTELDNSFLKGPTDISV